MGRGVLQKTDADLLSWSKMFSASINATPEEFGLTPQLAAQYAVLNSAYVEAYKTAIEPGTRTIITVASKNTARANLFRMAGQLTAMIQATLTVTDEQRASLGLTIRKKPSRIPAPKDRPGVTVVSVFGRTVTVNLYDTVSRSHPGKPKGVAGVRVFSFVGEQYPSDPSAWTVHHTSSAGHFDVKFPSTVPGGARVWICARWFNFRLQAGPASNPISTLVQGSVTMAA